MEMEKKMPRWVSTLLLAAVFWFVSDLLKWLLVLLPFERGKMAAWLLSAVLTVVSSGIPTLVVRPRLGRAARDRLIWASAVGVTTVSMQSFIISVVRTVLGAPGPEPELIPSSVLEWVPAIISTCIVPGICEEGLFRGAIQGSLTERFGQRKAILITAGLFAVVHRSMVAFPSHFLGSLLLSLTLIRTGSLLACMLQHMFYNLMVMLLDAFPDLWDQSVALAFYLVWSALLIVPLLQELHVRRKRKP